MGEAVLSAAVVTRKELLALAEAEEDYAQATAAATRAEKRLKPLRLALAEKVVGVGTVDALRQMSPDEVATAIEKRRGKGWWEGVRGAPQFSFVKTAEGRYPSWKQEYIREKGEVAAENIIAQTPTYYSYRVEVKA